MTIPDWQALRFRTPAEAGGIENPVSGFIVRGNDGVVGAINDIVPGVEAGTRQGAIEALPGYSAEMGTVRMIFVFLFLIAVAVLGALVSASRIARVDPLVAIGKVD